MFQPDALRLRCSGADGTNAGEDGDAAQKADVLLRSGPVDGTLAPISATRNATSDVSSVVSRVEMNGADVRLIGRSGQKPDATLAQGRFEDGVIRIPLNGATYDFTRVEDSSCPFYPRGNPPARYRYTPPLRIDDGWPVSTVESVGISRDAIERFVQCSRHADGSLNTSRSTALGAPRQTRRRGYSMAIIATSPRHASGRQELEATLIGAAMHRIPLRWTFLVPNDLGPSPRFDPRKRA